MKAVVWFAGLAAIRSALKRGTMIQIYTGEGKGKTTASVGLSVRASSSKKVLFVQVLKAGDSSEIKVLENIENITVKNFGLGERIFPKEANSEEKENTRKALRYLNEATDLFDVVVLDEGITAVDLKIISEDDILRFMKSFPTEKELIITGRGATKTLVDSADLVTEMRKIKHYYDKGQKSRKGIEL